MVESAVVMRNENYRYAVCNTQEVAGVELLPSPNQPMGLIESFIAIFYLFIFFQKAKVSIP